MLLESKVKEKLERIIECANARADAEIINGESAMGNGQDSFAAIGFATGARFVCDMILDEFDFLFLFPDNEDEDEEPEKVIVPEPKEYNDGKDS